MDKHLTINSYLKKNNKKQNHPLPKLSINQSYNITIYHNKIYSNRNYNRIENKFINTEASTKFHDYLVLNRKNSESQNKYLFKTIWTEGNPTLKYFNKKYLPLKTSKTKFKRKINNSQKVSMKILNVFFKPELTKSQKTIFSPKRIKKINRNYNFSPENKKEIYPNNYLYYYYPNLFNVPNNRILGPQQLNSSKYFVAPIPAQSFKDEVKSLKVSRIFNKDNGKEISLHPSIISSSKENKEEKNPVIIEKSTYIDILRNLRFGFKNSIEKSKYNNLVKSFYTAKNLKFVFPKSK